jgi:putative DNA primase/helicase
MIMNGKGKQRANVLGDARVVFDWRLNCLSSGEVSYAAFIQEGGKSSRGGQLVRMLDISADMGAGMGIFENIHGMKDSHTFAEQLKISCSNFYGTPIRAFIEALVGNMERLEPDFAKVKVDFFRDYVPSASDSQVQRVASKLSVAAMAGELATELGITGWQQGEAYAAIGSCFTRWLGDRGTTGQIESEKAVEQAKNFLLRHGTSRFIPIMFDINRKYVLKYPDRPYTNMAGYRFTTNNDTYEFIVFPEVFTNEICQGLNPQYVTKTLVELGYLQVEPSGKAQVRRRLPGMEQMRVYHFNPTIFDETDEFEPAAEETEEEQ